MLWDNVRTNEFVTSDTTPHVYGKAMLVVAFNSSMWIITIPYTGVSFIADSIVGKVGRYTSTAPNLATVANQAHVCLHRTTFLTQI
jgi:hypothetical protein